MPVNSQPLADLIQAEIAAAGPMSLARFMELALYHPVHGYYQRSLEQIGCQGDFYTSVSIGPLFGELLAFKFARWLEELRTTRVPTAAERPPLHLVEAGAHSGELARDILSWFHQHRPELLHRLEYWILEPSPSHQDAQQTVLAPFRPLVHWCKDWEGFPAAGVHGVVFSNELLDAFPCYRLGWDAAARTWFEWRVACQGEGFAWIRSNGCPSPELAKHLEEPRWRSLPKELLAVLPDGFTIELAPAALSWWSQAAVRLTAGKLLTFDYGLEWEEFFAPHRAGGTLRAYRGHHGANDPLAQPGEQDLTVHIDFSGIRDAGEAGGLTTESLSAQAAFLTGITREGLEDAGMSKGWSSSQRRQFQALTHPDHLGRAFKVLVQAR